MEECFKTEIYLLKVIHVHCYLLDHTNVEGR